MPFYLGQWIGAGTRRDPCVPQGVKGADWSVIDLRADGGATPAGGGVNALLLHADTPQTDPSLVLLADAETDVLTIAGKLALTTKLGLASVTALTFRDLLVELMTNPPAGKWKPVLSKPTTGLAEINLGPVKIATAVVASVS